MEWFAGKLAFVTGGGSGIGRCSVSTCDWNADAVADAAATRRPAPRTASCQRRSGRGSV